MQKILPKTLIRLAKSCPKPLYVVGGSVRDFLANLTPLSGTYDWDICSALKTDELLRIAQNAGFCVRAVYRNTGTIKLQDENGLSYEYSRFRSDKYVRGMHTPTEIIFTDDVTLDARRRDFTANAVYYDVLLDTFLDPLQGIPAIKQKRLSTVASAKKVFSEDGLRLMRLARQAARLGFSPDSDCLEGATQNAALICDISPERIFAELDAILHAETAYGVEGGALVGLELLSKTRVLDYIVPELALGRDCTQRPDFHKYDVLTHSLHAAHYAHPRVRLAALLHDVGKPFCMQRDNNGFAHAQEGARIAEEILRRLKAPKRVVEHTKTLIALHMYDFNCQTGENKLRRFFARHYDILEDLLLLKQADFSACMDDCSPAPTCVRWNALLHKLREEHAPLTIKALAISGKELMENGCPPALITEVLKTLLAHAVCQPQDNTKARLLRLAKHVENTLLLKTSGQV